MSDADRARRRARHQPAPGGARAARLRLGGRPRRSTPASSTARISAFGAAGAARRAGPGYDLQARRSPGFMPPAGRRARRPAGRLARPDQRHGPAAAGVRRRSSPRWSQRATHADGASAWTRRLLGHGGRPERALAGAHRRPPRSTACPRSRAPSTGAYRTATAGSPSPPTPSGSPELLRGDRAARPARPSRPGTTGPREWRASPSWWPSWPRGSASAQRPSGSGASPTPACPRPPCASATTSSTTRQARAAGLLAEARGRRARARSR